MRIFKIGDDDGDMPESEEEPDWGEEPGEDADEPEEEPAEE